MLQRAKLRDRRMEDSSAGARAQAQYIVIVEAGSAKAMAL
jgi:hypothetical protein